MNLITREALAQTLSRHSGGFSLRSHERFVRRVRLLAKKVGKSREAVMADLVSDAAAISEQEEVGA